MGENSQTVGVHLVGSLPLETADQVFEVVGRELGRHVKRIPDGETGDRAGWIGWQAQVMGAAPQFEVKYPFYINISPRIVGLKAGAKPEDVQYPNLQYADAALASYARFEALQTQGVIPADVKFQVSLPTPVATSSAMFGPAEFAALEQGYEDAEMAELKRILDGIPHDKLAIQWDVCLEVWFVEGDLASPFQPVLDGCVERIARYSAAVPADVELGYHYCYGDYQHEHLSQPKDIKACADLINALDPLVKRSIEWIHIPVPIERDDDGYFAPLKGLKLRPETELYVGLVHFRDGVEGARRRIAAAHKVLPRFGVATECGMGRRTPGRGGQEDELKQLLDTHAAVAEPVR
jgi:hypothetical protein